MKVIFIFFIVYITSFSLKLTKSEELWLEKNKGKTFTLAIANTSNPFYYIDNFHHPKGVYIDFFHYLEKHMDIKFKYIDKPNKELTSLLNKGAIDIGLDMANTPKRKENYYFINLFNEYEILLITKDVINLNSLKHKKIGVICNTTENIVFKNIYPDFPFTLVPLNSLNEGFKKLENKEIDALLGKDKYLPGKNYNIVHLDRIDKISNQMAIKKEFRTFVSIIRKYRNLYTNDCLVTSLRKNRIEYYKNLLKNYKPLQEVQKKYKELIIEIPDENKILPFYYKKNNKFLGYIPERMEEFSQILNIPIILKKRSEILNLNYNIKAFDSINFKNHSKYLIPYYEADMVIVSKTNNKFIKNPKELIEKNLGIITIDDLKSRNLKYMKNSKIYFSTDEALDDLINNKVEYLVGDFKRISLAISNRYMGDSVKIAGFTNNQSYFSYGTNDPLLADLIEKIMPNYISENEILSNELVTNRIIDINHKYIFTIFTISMFVLIILLFLLKKATKEKNRANKITKALVNSFETANQYNDEDTGMHIIRVNKYSQFIARKLKCSKKFIEEIGEYASLHDVGKIGIPDIILKKPGKLTNEEFEAMKEHTKIGFHLIKKMYIGKIAENIALYHHEKYNGKGYPFGLYGNEIPLEARIVSLADVYDALRQKRVYKKSFSHEEAMTIIINESGQSFDPKLVTIFIKYNDIFEEIFESN